MVETTSLREERPKLSAKERLCLIQTLNALPPTQFDELVFALDPPKGVVASNTAAQGRRSKDLLDWLEGSSGPGLAAADEVLQVLIPKATKTSPQPVAFVMMGQMGDLAPSELEAIVEILRQKTGDDSISLAFSREGSIKLILNGSPEGLAKLQAMFEAGELEQIYIPPVEAVAPVNSSTQDARKARLIQALRLRSYARKHIRKRFQLLRIVFSFIFGLILSLGLSALSVIELFGIFISLTFRLIIALIATLVALNAIDNTNVYSSYIFNYFQRRTWNQIPILNIRGADLTGANLKNINVRGADLTDVDLTNANVVGTIFGDNRGLTYANKIDLKRRGAIFQDSPDQDGSVLVHR